MRELSEAFALCYRTNAKNRRYARALKWVIPVVANVHVT